MISTLLGILLLVLALFLILIVLLQRGRGGGLAGALGGAGGQSAFGTKAGDTFTRVTIVTATVWILLCIVSILAIGGGSRSRFAGTGNSANNDITAPGNLGEDAPATGGAGPGATSGETDQE